MLRELPELAGASLALASARAASGPPLGGGATFAPSSRYLRRKVALDREVSGLSKRSSKKEDSSGRGGPGGV